MVGHAGICLRTFVLNSYVVAALTETPRNPIEGLVYGQDEKKVGHILDNEKVYDAIFITIPIFNILKEVPSILKEII